MVDQACCSARFAHRPGGEKVVVVLYVAGRDQPTSLPAPSLANGQDGGCHGDYYSPADEERHDWAYQLVRPPNAVRSKQEKNERTKRSCLPP